MRTVRHLHARRISAVLTAALLLALPGAVLATPAQGQESRAISAFKKAFRSSPKKPRTPQARTEALALLDGLDSKATAKALVDAYVAVDAEVTALDAQRIEVNDEMRELLAGQEFAKQRQLPIDKHKRYFELRDLSLKLRAAVDATRELAVAVRARITGLESDGALGYLVGDVVGSKKYPLPLKIAAARTAGGAESMVPDLHKALKRARRPAELIAVLDGLGLIGRAAAPAGADIIKLLGHKEEAVRERAALALSTIAVPAAIEPMIDLLARERGIAQQRIASALEVLTGQKHGAVPGAWRAWFENEGAEYVAGGKPLGGGEPSVRKATAKNYYMGIPQDGKAIVYVIDSSGSMKQIVNWKSPGQGERTSAGGSQSHEMSRLEACKGELIDALGRLETGKKFNVIWYSDLPHIHSDRMVVAGPQTIRTAQDWVRELQPNSSTNIHDSLQMAFGLIGRGARDKYYGIEIDTVFLLTDGSPTMPNGELDSTEKIIHAVREWNALKRVTVHCIGIGQGLNEPFLAQLARENGGEFKKF